MKNELSNLLTQVIKHVHVGEYDYYGNPIADEFKRPINYRARITYQPKRVKTSTGTTLVLYSGYAWVFENVNFNVDDLIILPTGKSAKVVLVERFTDDNQQTYTKVFFNDLHDA